MKFNDFTAVETFGKALENPQTEVYYASNSFEIYGKRMSSYDIMANDMVISQYETHMYNAKCKLCGSSSKPIVTSYAKAKHLHFEHCAREHGYIFPDSCDKMMFKVKDETLQAIITASTLFSLPMPGYDLHTRCIRQYNGSEIICVVHEGNESE